MATLSAEVPERDGETDVLDNNIQMGLYLSHLPRTKGLTMKTPLSPTRRPRPLLVPVIVSILLVAGICFFFFFQGKSQSPSLEEGAETIQPTTLPSATTLGETAPIPETPGNHLEQEVSEPLAVLPTRENLPQVASTITAFYDYLDQQEYIKVRHLATPSHIHFTRLLQKIIDTPPVVTRETDDLATILKNSLHLFRILGKDEIILIKEILRHEQDKIEEVMADYFLLTEQPDGLSGELALKLPENVRYEYACFFLNTMGGKLYLARRDSRTRMVVTYYAIMTIHQANIEGKNSNGLQLQPTLDLLTAEIETGGNHLHYKEAYLDSLYELKEKYQ